MKTDFATALAEMPLVRWQCSDGCCYLERMGGDSNHYRCSAMDGQPWPLAVPAVPTAREATMIEAKRIDGPHTDDPVRACAFYQQRSD